MPSAFLWDERVSRGTLASVAGTVAASMPLANLADPQPRMRARWLGSAASVLVDFGADISVEVVGLISTTLRTASGDTIRARVGNAEGIVEAPALFDLRFTDPASVVYPAGWAFNRASNGCRFDASGNLIEEGSNVPRFDYDASTLACRGLLLEEARTNQIRNPRCEGAAAGTPGTAPTNWTISAAGGLSSQVVGAGYEGGIPCIDVRISGTASVAGQWSVRFEPLTQIAASASQVWTGSAFVSLQAGGTVQGNISVAEVDGGGVVGFTSSATFTPGAGALRAQRQAHTRPLLSASFVSLSVSGTVANGVTVDFTLRIGAPQMELGPGTSSPILPPVGVPGVATRAADQTRVTGLSIGPATMLVQSTNWAAVGGGVPVPGGWAPPSGFTNTSYISLSASTGSAFFTARTGGVGLTRGIGGAFGTPTIYVGATGPGAVMFAANAAFSSSAATFAQPTGIDRASLGGAPWDGTPGLAVGIGVYARWALWNSRLSDAQVIALASTGSSRTAAGVAWDSGTLGVETDADNLGNTFLLPASAAVGRYLLVEVASPGAVAIDLGRLVAGPLWRTLRGFAYGAQEGREILDQRDRNPLTAAEFPRPALADPRLQRFTLPVLSNEEMRTAWRAMLARLGGVGDALWIPDTSLSRAELAARCIWGAIAAGGEEAIVQRDGLNANSRTFRVVERI